METDSSQNPSARKSDFLGLYLSPALKEEVEQTAERNGRSISEEARRRLQAGDGEENG
jgi:hypothetical protein